jgi:site-specific recombinase XerD
MNKIVLGSRILSKLRKEPLGFYIDSYLELLNEQGFSQQSAEEQVRVIIDFNRWLAEKGYKAGDVSQEKADQFLKNRYRHRRPLNGDSAALHRLNDLFLRLGVISSHVAPMSPPDNLLDDFRLHLIHERTLRERTSKTYISYVRKFLEERFSGVTIDFSKLRTQDITGFIRLHAQDCSHSYAKSMTKAMRSFLCYLNFRGDLTADLAACVPAVASWSLSDIPKFLEPDQIEQILDHCNLQAGTGLRDHAILLLLARLGLRACEVASLKIEDIDWEAAQITVHGKGGSSDQLPLPADVGKAIAIYLQRGRPRCASRYVFVRAKAPRQEFSGAGAICLIVKRALARAGINSQRKGAHLFRHGLASQMLRRGGSLSDIGAVLRHRDPNTTAIYAKVDFTALQELVRPWPGGEL